MMSAISEVRQRMKTNAAHQPRLTIFRACGYLLFFLMLFVPATYQSVKLGLLLICLISIVAAKPLIRPQKSMALAILLLSSIGASEILYGMIRGNEGAFRQVTIWVVWPLVFLLLSSAIYREHHIRSLFRVMVTASNAIGAYGCLYILTQTGHIPKFFFFPGISAGQTSFLGDDTMRISFPSFTSLLFLVPFLVALVITWPRDTPPVVRTYWIYLAILTNVVLIVLSGRRALLMVLALIPFLLIVAIFALTPMKQIVTIRVPRARLIRFVLSSLVVIAVVFVAFNALKIDLGATITSLTTGYKAAGDEARRVQFTSLMAGWRDNPIFGAGLGAVAPGSIRSIGMPWSYELSYVALLFDIGLVGILIYGVAVGNVIRRASLVARANVELRPWTIPVLVGMVSFLIANATNPYLLKFDSMWVLFLPVALLNVNALHRETGCQTTTEHSEDRGLQLPLSLPDESPHEG